MGNLAAKDDDYDENQFEESPRPKNNNQIYKDDDESGDESSPDGGARGK